ncbi:MAG: aminopeptidase P N-terminal domain-containing protein [Bacteroidales bacterium]|nr:aminopeptidase P N-terminal domain-containing protein [Bacteroidales bacterium]
MFNSDVYKARRQKLMSSLKDGLVLIPGNIELPFNYKSNTFPFRQDSTFLYYIGLDEPNLFAVLDCNSGNEYLFGNDLTMDDIIWTGSLPSTSEKAAMAGISNAKNTNELSAFVKNHTGKKHFIKPYIGNIAILIADLLGVKTSQLEELQSIDFIRAASEMRKIKEAVEIEEIEKSVNLTCDLHNFVMKWAGNAEEYYTERDVVGEIYKIAAGKGYFTSFPPIVTIHGEIQHNHSYNENLKKGRLLLVDAGAETSSHYAGDMTRTIPLGGKFSKRQKDIYDIVVKANWGIVDSAKPGVLWTELHNRAARIITSGLKDLGLMKGDTDDIVTCGAYALFFPHGLGHMIGLDVHDMENYGEDLIGYDESHKRSEMFGPNCLRYGLELRENMVMSDEPGIYFIPQLIDMWQQQGKFKDFIDYDRVKKYKDFGGVRLEDDILITANGSRVLGKGVAKNSKDVELYIAPEDDKKIDKKGKK